MTNAQDFWAGAARRLAFRRNAASWCEMYLPVLLWLSGAAAGALLILRLLSRDTRFLWFGWGGGLIVAAILMIAATRRQAFTFNEALARLDDVAHLHNRLVSAQAGIGKWPEPRPEVGDAARWNWPRLLTPVMMAGLLLAAVSLVQPPQRRGNNRPSEEPAAWSQVASWLQTLDQAKLADPEALRKLQEQVDELRRQPPEDWYAQDSLEAGDALRQEAEQGLRDMQTALQQSSDSMAEAARQGGQMPPSELKALSASLQQAIQGLQAGNLPANKELLNALKSFNPANLKQLSPEQMRSLQQRMSEGVKICTQCVGPRIGRAKPGGRPGGRGGGGETAPLNLNDEATNLHSRHTETASDDDMSRALPGDVLAVTKGKHTVDKNAPAEPVAGGAISSNGAGGDAVWRDSVTPEEGQVLQRYFK